MPWHLGKPQGECLRVLEILTTKSICRSGRPRSESSDCGYAGDVLIGCSSDEDWESLVVVVVVIRTHCTVVVLH